MSEIIYRDYKIKYRSPKHNRGIQEAGWYIYGARNGDVKMVRINSFSGPFSYRGTAKLYVDDLVKIRKKMKKFGWR